jgi:cellulose synthase (UDP-forming)
MSIVRKEYLNMIGGKFPDDTITEDFDLSLRFLEMGIVTRYVNERHGIGLCADDTDSFFRQRKRWATGNLDVWYHHFKRGKYFNIGKYLVAFDWYYLVQVPSKLFLMFVPLIFLMFGLVPLYVDTWYELVAFHLPFVISNIVALNLNSRNKYIPIITDAVSQTCCIAIIPSLARYITGFEGKTFHVTAKGSVKRKNNSLTVIYRRFVELLIILYLVFLPYRIYVDDLQTGGLWYVIGFWGVLSILTLYVMRKLLKEDNDKHITEKIECGKRQTHRLRKSKLASILKVFG